MSPRLLSWISSRIAPLHTAIFAALLGVTAQVGAQADPAGAPHRSRYVMHARLDPVAHRIDGQARIRFVNSASAPVDELVLHLYANAFESRHTVFAREGGFGLRGLELERAGSISLLELTSAGGDDLLAHADDELVPGDRTRLRVRLPSPVSPGATLELLARFHVTLPSLVARMGQAGDFVMAAQWFPKLAKLMPDGTFRSAPYHGAGEFDADFADYELTVDVPAGYVIAAPGERFEADSSPATRHIERYRLDRARDLAWAAATDLRRVVHAVAEPPLDVEVLAPPGCHRLATRQAELAARTLAQLSELLGAYPHARLVLVIPPATALGAAGMEYPGLIVGWTATPWARLFPAASLHDAVTAHEVAHQWFPMLVASNELENPVLDEGLAEWLGLHVLRDDRLARLLGLPLDAFDLTAVALAAERDVPSSWLAANQIALSQLAAAMYFRPAVVLEALAERGGRARVLRMLGAYARENRHRHVTPSDLARAIDAEFGPGFAARSVTPALAGERGELTRNAPRPGEAVVAQTIPARLLSLAQLALTWIAL